MKENKLCPSYDCGFCETSPFPYSVKCKDLTNCAWHDMARFKKNYKEVFGENAYNKKFGE